MTHVTRSEAETRAVARRLAAGLRAGDVVLLSGDLGSGKTAFVKGLAEGLHIDPDEVSSPTFALLHEYRGGSLTLYHADLYRLPSAATADLAERPRPRAGVANAPVSSTHLPRGAGNPRPRAPRGSGFVVCPVRTTSTAGAVFYRTREGPDKGLYRR